MTQLHAGKLIVTSNCAKDSATGYLVWPFFEKGGASGLAIFCILDASTAVKPLQDCVRLQ